MKLPVSHLCLFGVASIPFMSMFCYRLFYQQCAAAEQQAWAQRATEYIECVKRERSMVRVQEHFQYDVEALIDLLQTAARCGVPKDYPQREYITNILCEMLCDVDLERESLRDGRCHMESILTEFPEVVQRMKPCERTRLLKSQNKLRWRRRRAMLQYMMGSRFKIFVYGSLALVTLLKVYVGITSTACTIAEVESFLTRTGQQHSLSLDLILQGCSILVGYAVKEILDNTVDGMIVRITRDVTNRHRVQQEERFFESLLLLDMSFYDTHDANDIDFLTYYLYDLEGIDTQLHYQIQQTFGLLTNAYFIAKKNLRCGVLIGAVVCLSERIRKTIQSWAESVHSYSTWCHTTPIHKMIGTIITKRRSAEEEDQRRIDISVLTTLLADLRTFRALGSDRAVIAKAYDLKLKRHVESDHLYRHHVKEQVDNEQQNLLFPVQNVSQSCADEKQSIHRIIFFMSCKVTHETLLVLMNWWEPASRLLQWWLIVLFTRERSLGEVYSFADLVCDFGVCFKQVSMTMSLLDNQAYKAHSIESIMISKDHRTKENQGLNEVTTSEALYSNFSRIERSDTSSRPVAIWCTSLKKDDGSDPTFADEISFDHVSFRYPSRPSLLVLNDVSFVIPSGGITVIRGPNGCGKSTVLSLLLRLYDPCAGVIKIRGLNIQDIGVSSWRHTIGFVPQVTTILSDGTLEENIRCFRNATSAEVETALARAGALDFVNALPERLLTKIGRKPAFSLSGGQTQRVGIARALLKEPRLLLLDEPVTHLDEPAIQAMYNVLRELSRDGVTIVVVAHNEDMIALANHVISLPTPSL